MRVFLAVLDGKGEQPISVLTRTGGWLIPANGGFSDKHQAASTWRSSAHVAHPTAIARLLKLKAWTPVQGMLLEQMHAGLVSAIGEVARFTPGKKLVASLGLNPSVCQSGEWEGGGKLKRHGRGPIRALLVQRAKKLLGVDHPLQKWGLAVAARRGRNKAAVAVARKLAVAVGHGLNCCLAGRWFPLFPQSNQGLLKVVFCR